MKKLFIFMGALLLGVGAFGAFGKKAEIADATEYTGVAALLNEYAQGKEGNHKYTKKTTIFVKTEVEGYDAAFFHASNQQFQRTTYYADDILLMGDLNGGFEYINSGYANDGEGNMVHFSSKAGTAALDDPTKWTVDYTVTGKTMADYFYGLAELADLSNDASKWTVNNGVYTHTITDLSVSGEYNDPLLKGFQYFAAPMLLTHRASDSAHYFSPSSIVVAEQNGVLSIKIYAASDTGKLWSDLSPRFDTGLLAEARVYKDTVMPGYFLIGDFTEWKFDNARKMGNGDESNYAKLENVQFAQGFEFKIIKIDDDGYLEWHGNNDNNDWNTVFDCSGTYSFYYAHDGKTYTTQSVSGPVTFSIVPSGWKPEGHQINSGYEVIIKGSFDGWSGEVSMAQNGDRWTATVNWAAGSYEYKYVIRKIADGSLDWNTLNSGNRNITIN